MGRRGPVAADFIDCIVYCQDIKKIPRPSGLVSWIDVARPVGLRAPSILGASTVGRSTQNSHTTSIGPPADRTLLSGGASVDSGRLLPGSLVYNPEGSVVDVSSGARNSMVRSLPQEVLLVDTTVSLHPFFVHELDVAPICLTTIAHAFNYRVAVLRDGAKSAARVGRSRRAAGRFLEDVGLPWGHQVAVMFQIVCALALEVPSVLLDIESLHDLSPNVILPCELRGHVNHSGGGCECISSDSTDAYVHGLPLIAEEVPSTEARDEESSAHSVDCSQECDLTGTDMGHPGSVPFVSHRPGAYGGLLLAAYV